MTRSDKSQASKQATRTRIEDLAPADEELSEEEAYQATGGMVVIRGTFDPPIATRVANTCTAGNALTGPDSDYGND